jgi:hypothetical protein
VVAFITRSGESRITRPGDARRAVPRPSPVVEFRAVPTFTLLAKHAALDAANAQLLAQLAREADVHTPMRPTAATAGGDEAKLRGLPAIGRGVSGAIRGTKPGASL